MLPRFYSLRGKRERRFLRARTGCRNFLNLCDSFFRLTGFARPRYPFCAYCNVVCPNTHLKQLRQTLSRRFMSTELRNFLSLSYDELEQLNLKAKEQRKNRIAPHKIQEERIKYLTDEKRIKAVTVLFSDLEGRLHMLDYDKKFLIKSWDNLTFDGSSIRGFTAQRESDLRLAMDWGSFYWAPSDVFGSGKVLVFGEVIDKDGSPYSADIRGIVGAVLFRRYSRATERLCGKAA